MLTSNIQQALNQGTHGQYPVPIDGGYREVPIARIPIESLLYRPQNGRIAVEKRARIRALDLPEDFFDQPADTPKVQEVLEQLLLEIAQDPRGPIHQELARTAKQTEPLLINHHGVVLNGNRRLAAMRDLHRQDPQRYADFSTVLAGVLPEDFDESAEERIEAALQMTPETKLGYGWIHRRLKLRRQRDELGIPEAQIIDAYRLEGREQLDIELGELALAEAFLKDFLEDPEAYERIADAEVLFTGLHARLAELKAPLIDVWRAAGFAMIGARDALDVRLDTYTPFVAPKPHYAPTVVAQRLGGALDLWPTPERGDDRAKLKKRQAERLATVLANPDLARDHARLLVEALDRLGMEFRAARAPGMALQRLKQASELLGELSLDDLSPGQLREVRRHLSALEHHAHALLEETHGRCEPGQTFSDITAFTRPLKHRLGDALRRLRGR